MSDLEQISLFVLIAIGIVATLGDSYFTGIGLSKGLVEGNPINRFMFKKVGQALTTFTEIAVFIAVSLLISVVYPMASLAFAAGIGLLEAYNTYRNWKLVR